MLIIGLTGSMATGKSILLNQIKKNLRWPTWDADAQIQKLYGDPKIIQQILQTFPHTGKKTSQGWHIHRPKLKEELYQNPLGLSLLEDILYPPLMDHRTHFLRTMGLYKQKIVILDIPLLFEKGMDTLCDLTIVTHCPEWLQKQRILQRPGMTIPWMTYLLSYQISLAEKQKLAHIKIETGLNKHESWISFCKYLPVLQNLSQKENQYGL